MSHGNGTGRVLPVVRMLLAVVAWLVVLAAPAPARAAEKLVIIGIQIEDAVTGNGDGELSPGEEVRLKLGLYNDGDTASGPITGILAYTGNVPGVTVTLEVGTWPSLDAKGLSQLSEPPHQQVLVDSRVPCGAVLRFHLDLLSSSEVTGTDFTVKLGRRDDLDNLLAGTTRIDRPEGTWLQVDPNDVLSAAASGDINGDGYADLAMGAWGGDSIGNSRPDAGEAYLVYGGPDRKPGADLTLPGAAVRFWGADPTSFGTPNLGYGDAAGKRLAFGDINGDGYDDLLISAPEGDGPGNTRMGCGEVYLIYGKAAPWTDTDLASPPAGIVRIYGPSASEQIGTSLSAGDVNGDGFDDILIGGTGERFPPRQYAGSVYVLFGKAAPWTDTEVDLNPAVIRFRGAALSDAFGDALAAGDINGDGYDDILAGAIQKGAPWPNEGSGVGQAYIIYGKSGPWANTDLASPGPGITRFFGGDPNDLIGQGAAAGDINDDGFDDFVVGALGDDGPGESRTYAGKAFVIFGRSSQWPDTDLRQPSADIVRIWGRNVSHPVGAGETGRSVQSTDVNGDGIDDLIVTSPSTHSLNDIRNTAGEVSIIYGSRGPWTDVDLSFPHSGVGKLWGGGLSERLGMQLATGDADGDGRGDLLVVASEKIVLAYGRPTDTYQARPVPPMWIEASAGGTQLPLSCDDCAVPIDLPFPVPYYGEEYTRVEVSSNGFFSFAPVHLPSSFTPVCFPSRDANNLMVAPLWTDLNPAVAPAGSGVFWKVEGSAPNRRLVIEWKGLPHYPNVGDATFEAIVYEGTGRILFQYLDLDFGSPLHDGGASAVVGVENRTGAHGVPFSCTDGTILSTGAAVHYMPTTPIYENRGEHRDLMMGVSGGLWHRENVSCEPNRHSGGGSWYFGETGSCFDGGVASGGLHLPAVPGFPMDAQLSFWYRREAEAGDLAEAQISSTGTGGPYTTVAQTTDASGLWRYRRPISLAGHGGETIDARFWYDSAAGYDALGWMVDDVQLTGCNAVPAGGPGGGTGGGASAYSFTSAPAAWCRGSLEAVFDSLGSSCGDESEPAYQWKVNGAAVPGATQSIFALPAVQAGGRYDVSVEVSCLDGSVAESGPAGVDIVHPPDPVGPSLNVDLINGGTELLLSWDAVEGAEGYEVWQDRSPAGSFDQIAGEPTSDTALVLAMPPGDTFFLTGAFSQCGRSAKKAGISHIDDFLEQCPTVDPAMSAILNDFHIRRDGNLVTTFPGCAYPVSQVPIAQWSDELIALQGLRTLYYMDLGMGGYLPWTSLRAYDWLKSKVQGFNIVTGSGSGGSCCEIYPDGTYITMIGQSDSNRDLDRIFEGISGELLFYLHEARHVDGFLHSSCCAVGAGACDTTYDESSLSSYGIQYWVNRALIFGDINVGIGCLPPLRRSQIVQWLASSTFEERFCTNAPPHPVVPPGAGGPCIQ